MKVLARLPHQKDFLPLHDDDEMPPSSVKVQVDGLEITILRRGAIPNWGGGHASVDIRVDPINGQAVGIEHEVTTISRVQVHLRLIADDTGRGIMP